MDRVLQHPVHDGYVLRERYRFSLVAVLSPPDGAKPDEVTGALQLLLALTFAFEEPNQAGFQLLSLLDTTKEHLVGHDGQTITLVLNPQLRNYLLNVARLDAKPVA